ncbi:hypothetical protein GFS31_37450 [Leptolyngbya sp. BL0902]|nr:hypothetical protein GFS31_37450 [Leptolyngbya sp. BL0902]
MLSGITELLVDASAHGPSHVPKSSSAPSSLDLYWAFSPWEKS